MSAKHALLGLLLERAAYPYELADRMQRRLGPAWEINSGQVSQEIRRMEEAGWIERVEDAAAVGGRGARQYITITDDGVQEYERWFAMSSQRVRLSRRPLLVKIGLAGPERLTEALRQIAEYERECTESLRKLASMKELLTATDEGQVRADEVLLRLGLSADIFGLEGELRWTEQARETVEWLLGNEVLWPSPRDSGQPAKAQSTNRARVRHELFGQMSARDLRALPGGQDDAPD